MPKEYREIVFLTGEDFDHWYSIYDTQGLDSGFDYLYQWEYGDDKPNLVNEPWGSADDVWYLTKYGSDFAISYNWHLSYVALTEVIT